MRPLQLLNESTLPTLSEVAATHCRSIKLSLIANTFTSNKIINSYTKCKETNAARKLFDEMPHRDTSSWNTIITAGANSGDFFGSWEVLKSMKELGFLFDGYTFVSILKGVSIGGGGVVYGQLIHSDIVKMGFSDNVYSASALLSMYAKFSKVEEANKVFQHIPEQNRDASCWNTIITGYVKSGKFLDAWEVLKSMKRSGFLFDGYTFGSILKGVASGGGFVYGLQVHSDVVKMGFYDNVYAASALLDMYAKWGSVEDADKVFRYMSERNTVSWNALISGYAEMSNYLRCIELFLCMGQEGVRVDDGTFVPLLTLLDDVEFYEFLRQLHGKITKLGLEYENTVVNAMITAYSQCGCIEDSKTVFSSTKGYRDLVTWNSMLAGYLEHNMVDYVLNLFLEMVRRGLELDSYSYSSIISACFSDAQRLLGKSLHNLVIKKGLEQLRPVSNALMSMYTKSNSSSMEDAIKVFEQTNLKDLVSWNIILTGFSQKGLSENAMSLFRQVHLDYLVLDQYTFAAALRSCSDMATLQLGREIHVLVVKYGFEQNEYVASALIFMYSKCGIIEDSRKSFDASQKKTSVTWNSLIFAYAQHGQGKTALDLFHLMKEARVKVDHITFVAAITACSHIGLVEEGLKFLKTMESQHGIIPQMENYACTIDLLGRAGRLMEVKELIKEMPFEPNAMVWKTLLGVCRACHDIELAKQVADYLLELEPGEHSTYVLLSELYGYLKMWDEKASVKRLMKEKGVKKVPGWSWIELNNDVNAFNAEDYSHSCSQEIYQTLEELMGEVKVSEEFCIIDENSEPSSWIFSSK